MNITLAKILKPGMTVIKIDSGHVVLLQCGATYKLESSPSPEFGFFLLLAGTRDGAVVRWWLDMEKIGNIELTRTSEQTLAGIPLPITKGSRLTEDQKDNLICGYLVGGKFKCLKCYTDGTPKPIPVVPRNILPYSQSCGCGLQIFNLWQLRKGGPRNLFNF